METQENILVVDDDPSVATLVSEILIQEGFAAHICLSANEALKALEDAPFNLVILDIMMPEIDGFELCRLIRSKSKLPIIFLSAKQGSIDKVAGLTVGADDYITKPFEPYELIARVKAHLRRSSWAKKKDAGQTLTCGELVLSLRSHECHIGSSPVELTPKEFEILRLLMEEPETPHPIKEIFETIWMEPCDDAGSKSTMVHIRRIRKKLAEANNAYATCISTVWGVGYKMQV